MNRTTPRHMIIKCLKLKIKKSQKHPEKEDTSQSGEQKQCNPECRGEIPLQY